MITLKVKKVKIKKKDKTILSTLLFLLVPKLSLSARVCVVKRGCEVLPPFCSFLSLTQPQVEGPTLLLHFWFLPIKLEGLGHLSCLVIVNKMEATEFMSLWPQLKLYYLLSFNTKLPL